MRTRRQKKTEFLSVRVSRETKDRLETIAEENDRSLSWVVAKMIEASLGDRAEKKQ